MVLRLNHLH